MFHTVVPTLYKARISHPQASECLHELLCALRPSQAEPDRALIRLEDQFKREEGTAGPLVGDELRKLGGPFRAAWEAEFVAIGQLVALLEASDDVGPHALGSLCEQRAGDGVSL